MRITGDGIWGPPDDPDAARRLLKRAVQLGVNLIDTADSYGPEVSENLIAEALHPYPDGLVIATKGGLRRTGPGEWPRDARPERLRACCEASLRRLRPRSSPSSMRSARSARPAIRGSMWLTMRPLRPRPVVHLELHTSNFWQDPERRSK
jgi:hypothetical protein